MTKIDLDTGSNASITIQSGATPSKICEKGSTSQNSSSESQKVKVKMQKNEAPSSVPATPSKAASASPAKLPSNKTSTSSGGGGVSNLLKKGFLNSAAYKKCALDDDLKESASSKGLNHYPDLIFSRLVF